MKTIPINRRQKSWATLPPGTKLKLPKYYLTIAPDGAGKIVADEIDFLDENKYQRDYLEIEKVDDHSVNVVAVDLTKDYMFENYRPELPDDGYDEHLLTLDVLDYREEERATKPKTTSKKRKAA